MLTGCSSMSSVDIIDEINSTFCSEGSIRTFSNARGNPLYFECTDGSRFRIPAPDITYDSVGAIYGDYLDLQESICHGSRIIYLDVNRRDTTIHCANNIKTTLRGIL